MTWKIADFGGAAELITREGVGGAGGEVELIFERKLHKRLEEFANRDLVQE